MSGIINFLLRSTKVPSKLKDKISDLSVKKIIRDEIKNNLEANKPLKLYRAENYPGQAPFMRPDTDPKKEFVGRWFTTDKNFVNRFAANPINTKAIKTLSVDSPVKPSPIGTHKTISELMKQQN